MPDPMLTTPQTHVSDHHRTPPAVRSTTVLLVRQGGKTVMASDGQVTLQDSIIKTKASKVKRVGRGDVIVGFAGSAADGLALFTRFEGKLDEFQGNLERAVIELAKDWRTDRVLRQLQAMMIIADNRQSFLMSGTGDLLQPDGDRSQSRSAQLIQPPGGGFRWNARVHRRLPGGVLTFTRRQDLAHDDLIDLTGFDAGPLESARDCRRTQLVGGNIGKCTIEGTNCGPGRAGDYD